MRRLLVDMSSLLWKSLLASKSPEYGFEVEHEGKKVHVNGWQHGYECAINHLVAVLGELRLAPSDTIFVVEGLDAKCRRKAIYRDYKEGRDSRPPEAYMQFGLCKTELLKTFRGLGSQIVTQDRVEADDVIAYLARHLKGEKIILTTDGDLATLIDDSTSLWRGDELTKANPYGPFPARFIPVYKALVGDGNEYKGANLFGPKSFLDMLATFGEECLPALEGMMKRKTLHTLIDDVPQFKLFNRVISSAEHVYESYFCAILHSEWVNTLREPLIWKGGMVKPCSDTRLAAFGQKLTLVTADNYERALAVFKREMANTTAVALDIESDTPEDSDAWLAEGGREEKVDVFGSVPTGISLTFGQNGQYTFYCSVNHARTHNLDTLKVAEMVNLIPRDCPILIQNVAFELPILYASWGEYLQGNGWRGFVPNALDTAMMSSYVDENRQQGLKANSELLLDYKQVTYSEVTTVDGVQLKMSQLSAEHVLSYGTDDTICTMALYKHFRIIMEIEDTWDTFVLVEQKASYVKALAFHQGVRFNLERMNELEAEDQATVDKNWQVVREFLLEQGWEGTQCPQFSELTPANIKTACRIILGVEFKTLTRTPSKMAKLMLDEDLHPEIARHEDAGLLSKLITDNCLDQVNDWMKHRFSGEPVLDQNSPREMAHFLYDVLNLPVRLVNKPTPTEWDKKPLMSALVSRHIREWSGYTVKDIPENLWVTHCLENGIPYPCDKEAITKELLKAKAKVDEKAILFALSLDTPNNKVLKAIQIMKTCGTRKSMFYKAYKYLRHWKDNRIHGQSGQCRAVTRRDTPNNPNLSQLPKKGDGVKFRQCFLPHKKGAVVVSLDFSGQELRHGAAQSGDPGMLACFIGENLKDIHSMTATGAMEKKWGLPKLVELRSHFGHVEDKDDYDLFMRLRKCKEDREVAKMADDLRKTAKNVNFLAQYDGQAPKLAMMLIIPVDDAQTFLDAKYAMFSRFEEWKTEVKEESKKTGYVTTCLGARRHLRDSILSDEKWIAEAAMRQGTNFKIQGSSGEQTKLAQGRLWDSGILFTKDVSFYFSVHDELVASVVREDALEVIKVLHDCMVVPYGGLKIPFLASISLGPNFGEQIECGDWYIRENIEAALSKVFDKQEASV